MYKGYNLNFLELIGRLTENDFHRTVESQALLILHKTSQRLNIELMTF